VDRVEGGRSKFHANSRPPGKPSSEEEKNTEKRKKRPTKGETLSKKKKTKGKKKSIRGLWSRNRSLGGRNRWEIFPLGSKRGKGGPEGGFSGRGRTEGIKGGCLCLIVEIRGGNSKKWGNL